MFLKSKKIIIAILVVVLTSVGVFVYLNQEKLFKKQIKEKQVEEKRLTSQEIGEKAINFINQNILKGQAAAVLTGIIDLGDLYKIRLKIGEKEYDSYITKDGKFLFPEGINLEEEELKARENKQNKKTCETIIKTEKPLLEVFVVSKCPYGLQIQKILNEIVKSIPLFAENIRVEYLGSVVNDKIQAMHGENEAEENLRQICIREEQKDKYWNYIDCHLIRGEIEKCLTKTEIDKEKLNLCMKDNSRGLQYAKKDFELQEKYKIAGSPGLILNGEEISEFDFGGRTAEAIKTLLCCGFKAQPNKCSQKLSQVSPNPGFLETGGQSSNSGGGKCGQ